MNRRLLPAACLLAVALTGCSGSGAKPGSTAAPSASGAAVSGPTYTGVQASTSLLVITDLPPGYKKDPNYRHDAIPAGCPAVDAALAAETKRAPQFAVSSFRNDDDTVSVDHEVELFATPADAAAQFDLLIPALKTCPSWPLGPEPGAATISLTPTETEVLGSRSAVLQLTVEAGKDALRGNELIVVSGNAIVTLAVSGSAATNADPRFDPRRLAMTLLQRLRGQVG